MEKLLELRPESSDERDALLKKALTSRYASVVVKAVRRIVEWEVDGLTDSLVAAYQRLAVDGAKRDPGCRAKIGILKVFKVRGFSDHLFYLESVGYQQFEAVFGGKEDTAAEVRGMAALGLASSGWTDAAEHLVSLLIDREAAVRVSAIRALAALGEPLVIRLRTLMGDDEPQVMGECFESLLAMEGQRAVPFVAGFLTKGEEEWSELAALALGASRFSSAFQELRTAWDHLFGQREILMIALATLRHPDADSFLRELVTEGAAGIECLRPFGFLPEVRDSLPG